MIDELFLQPEPGHCGEFSPSELSTLREHGVVFFADRVIYEAQPPLEANEAAAIAALCAGGQIPSALLKLWSLTAGGKVAYDMTGSSHGTVYDLAFGWLFQAKPSTYGYLNLDTWIDHELDLAKAAARRTGVAWDGKLSFLPFGGYEYFERAYIDVTAGPTRGQIVVWVDGAGEDADTTFVLAPNLHAMFTSMRLNEDPRHAADPHAHSKDFLEHLNDRCGAFGLDQNLADRLIEFYRRAHRH